jgi:predicted nucleic acid-binding protein
LKLIDANVFIYAAGRPHPLQEPSQSVLSRAVSDREAANTDVEVLQELLNYYYRNASLDYGRDVIRNALSLFDRPFIVGVRTVESAQALLAGLPDHISARDAVHAAVVLEHRLEGIISTDRGFDAIPGVTRFDPRDL